MCGIAGIFNLDGRPVSTGVLQRMNQVIKHRGPDDEGYFLANTRDKNYELAGGGDTPEAVWASRSPFVPRDKIDRISPEVRGFNLTFGHRRLSIFDLSPAGHQPMCNDDGTIWLTYNGEIYNYIELREELKGRGYRFTSNTDTEVVIHAYEEWGYDCLKEFNGVWAFALWDMKSGKLFCARDRFGVKPFYYYFNSKIFVFASEIKALLEHPEVPRKANEEAVYNYLLWGLLVHPVDTFFKGIKELKASHYLVVDADNGVTTKKWWNLEVNSENNFSTDSIDGAAQQFLELLEDSIRLRLRGDVPVGALLSGGLDSSSIVCLTDRLINSDNVPNSRLIGEKQKTFSACYEDTHSDERRFIEAVTKKVKTEKNYVFPDGDGLWRELPLLVWHQDEPFLSTSMYAQWCVMRKAGTMGVKVLLDGQGGDELLAGYNHYFGTLFLELLLGGRIGRLAHESRCAAANMGVRYSSSIAVTALIIALFETLPISAQFAARNMSLTLRGRKAPELLNPSFSKRLASRGLAAFKQHNRALANLQQVLQRDLWTSLGAYFHYGDRDCMASSIEARVPFVDHRIVEYLFSLPASLKMRDGWTKWILRQAMQGILPEEVRLRKDKLGMPTPESTWLRHNGKKIIALFSSGDVLSRDYINPAVIANNLDDLLSRRTTRWEVWHCLNLELWLRAFFSTGLSTGAQRLGQ